MSKHGHLSRLQGQARYRLKNGTKNIHVPGHIHESLNSLKKPGEGYADVIERLIAEHDGREQDAEK